MIHWHSAAPLYTAGKRAARSNDSNLEPALKRLLIRGRHCHVRERPKCNQGDAKIKIVPCKQWPKVSCRGMICRGVAHQFFWGQINSVFHGYESCLWVKAHLLMCGSLGCESGANGCYILWGNSGVHCTRLLNSNQTTSMVKDILSGVKIQRWLLLLLSQTVLALSKMSLLLNPCALCLARIDWRLSYVATCICPVFVCTDLSTTPSLHKELFGFWISPV